MSHPGFKVTIEDLENGEKQAMVIYEGDYLLVPFEPCHRSHVQVHANGTHVITVKGHAPAQKGRAVAVEEGPTDGQ